MIERKGEWIQTFTGKKFYVLDPRPEDFDIRDVGRALSNMCRYAGHTSEFYSVAEHCLLMAELAEEWYGPAIAYEALMHDGSEAYLPDIPRPVKRSLPEVDKAAQDIERHFNAVFDIPFPTSPVIKELDHRIVVNEKNALMNHHGGVQWHGYNMLEPLPVKILCLSPNEAEAWYLERYEELKGYAGISRRQSEAASRNAKGSDVNRIRSRPNGNGSGNAGGGVQVRKTQLPNEQDQALGILRRCHAAFDRLVGG